MSGYPRSELTLEISENLERCTTVCTVEISREREFNTPQPPLHARMGDDWLALCRGGSQEEHLLESDPRGYHALKPEGLAMKFLRLAWLAAHHELRQNNKPFDGDPSPSWDKQ